jgi:hypothetical protein
MLSFPDLRELEVPSVVPGAVVVVIGAFIGMARIIGVRVIPCKHFPIF